MTEGEYLMKVCAMWVTFLVALQQVEISMVFTMMISKEDDTRAVETEMSVLEDILCCPNRQGCNARSLGKFYC
jgi:hypothetical protein